jgi:hypothetical protein
MPIKDAVQYRMTEVLSEMECAFEQTDDAQRCLDHGQIDNALRLIACAKRHAQNAINSAQTLEAHIRSLQEQEMLA